MNDKHIKIFTVNTSSKTAGLSPANNERIEIFFAGCKMAREGNPCEGCFNKDLWYDDSFYDETPKTIIENIKKEKRGIIQDSMLGVIICQLSLYYLIFTSFAPCRHFIGTIQIFKLIYLFILRHTDYAPYLAAGKELFNGHNGRLSQRGQKHSVEPASRLAPSASASPTVCVFPRLLLLTPSCAKWNRGQIGRAHV